MAVPSDTSLKVSAVAVEAFLGEILSSDEAGEDFLFMATASVSVAAAAKSSGGEGLGPIAIAIVAAVLASDVWFSGADAGVILLSVRISVTMMYLGRRASDVVLFLNIVCHSSVL